MTSPGKCLQTGSFTQKGLQFPKKQFQVNLWFWDKRTPGSLFVSNKDVSICWQGDRQTWDKCQFYAAWIWASLKQNGKAQGWSIQTSCLGTSLVVTRVTRVATAEPCHQWSSSFLRSCNQLQTTSRFLKRPHLLKQPLPFTPCHLFLNTVQAPESGTYRLGKLKGPA